MKQPLNFSERLYLQHLPPLNNTAHTHNTLPVKWPVKNQNGIVRSFVASKKNYLVIKRGFDIFFSAFVIVLVLSWLIPLMAVVIKTGSRGPVFFRQKRVGKNGKLFFCLKFRTMFVNDHADEIPALENDERITRTGRFLRFTNLDELPQFINVLLGDMSIVGPRPHMVADCIRFSFVVPSYQFRNLVRPGITGLAQVKGCHGITPDYDSILLRYYWDAQYIRKATLVMDLKIIARTAAYGFGNMRKALFGKRRKTLESPAALAQQ